MCETRNTKKVLQEDRSEGDSNCKGPERETSFKLEKCTVFYLLHMGQRLSLASLWFLSIRLVQKLIAISAHEF